MCIQVIHKAQDKQEMRELINKVKLTANFQHRNLVKLIGWVAF
jgi:uncharacterized protein YegL